MRINRRDLFRGALGILGGVALDAAIPLGRVWSFPAKIVLGPRVTFSVISPHEVIEARLNGVPVLRGIDFDVIPTKEQVIRIVAGKGFESWQHVELCATVQGKKLGVGASLMKPDPLRTRVADNFGITKVAITEAASG